MRYSSTVAALFATMAVAHVQENPAPGAEEGEYYEFSTAYSTAEVTITACDSTVKDCPLRSHTSVPVVETPLPSVPVSQPAPEATAVEVPVESHPSVPVFYSASVPLYPTAPSVPSPPFPIGTAPAGSPCPVCSTAVTVYSTLTGIPTEAASEVPVPYLPGSGVPAVPVPSGVLVPQQSVPIPSGGAPAGTGASSGFLTGPQPTSSPIAGFTGSASTLGKSLALAGFAALAATMLI